MSRKGETVYGSADLFARDMRKLINDDELSDIQFIVGEDREKISAHKVVLAGRCEVFHAMFMEQRRGGRNTSKRAEQSAPLVLADVRPTVFLTVLEFIYTNTCTLTDSIVVDVLASAIEYQLEGLSACCVEYMSNNLRTETVCEAIQAAITYNHEELRDTCMAFIEGSTQAVFKSKSFVEMSEETLCYILQSDKLRMDEEDIFGSVKDWGTVNAVVAGLPVGEVVGKVIQFVRFPLINSQALTQIEKDNEKTGVVPDRLISKAWRYHATKTPLANDPQFKTRTGTHT